MNVKCFPYFLVGEITRVLVGEDGLGGWHLSSELRVDLVLLFASRIIIVKGQDNPISAADKELQLFVRDVGPIRCDGRHPNSSEAHHIKR